MTTTSVQFSLARGERQLWAGVPRQGIILQRGDALGIPFNLLWAGFAVVFAMALVGDGTPVVLRPLAIPIFVLAVYWAIGRFWVDSRRRARTTYAVTSERIIINYGLFKPTSRSIDVRTLSEVTLRERKDGTGTITFRAVPPLVPMRGPFSPRYPAFEMIPDAWRVCAVIRDAQRGTSSGDTLSTPSAGGSDRGQYEPYQVGRSVSGDGVQVGKLLKRAAAVFLVILGVFIVTSRNKGPRVERLGIERLTSAQMDSLRRLPTIVDTFIVTPAHVELTVGDTFRLSSLRMEVRDRTGRRIHWDNTTFSFSKPMMFRGIASGWVAVAPGHTSLLVEDRPRDFNTDSIPKRPWTRVDIDIRR